MVPICRCPAAGALWVVLAGAADVSLFLESAVQAEEASEAPAPALGIQRETVVVG